MAYNCTENRNNPLSKECAEVLHRIPVLRYLKDPVVYLDDLYKRYPQGGEYGWYAFVTTAGTFAYWDDKAIKWELLSIGDLKSILGADTELLREGDIPIWDEENEKFEIINLNVIGTEDY